MAGGTYQYLVVWYDETGKRFETSPMRSSEGAAAVARSKVNVGYLKVTIHVAKV